VRLSERRLGALVVSVALAGCRNAAPPDGPAERRGAATTQTAASVPAARPTAGRDRGVASTDAALLVEEASR
jgi:hypothetical protein